MSAHCSLQHSCDGNIHSAAVLSALQCARLYWLLNYPSPTNPYSVTFAKLIISRLTTWSFMKTFDCVRAWYHTCVSPVGVDIERVCCHVLHACKFTWVLDRDFTWGTIRVSGYDIIFRENITYAKIWNRITLYVVSVYLLVIATVSI